MHLNNAGESLDCDDAILFIVPKSIDSRLSKTEIDEASPLPIATKFVIDLKKQIRLVLIRLPIVLIIKLKSI